MAEKRKLSPLDNSAAKDSPKLTKTSEPAEETFDFDDIEHLVGAAKPKPLQLPSFPDTTERDVPVPTSESPSENLLKLLTDHLEQQFSMVIAQYDGTKDLDFLVAPLRSLSVKIKQALPSLIVQVADQEERDRTSNPKNGELRNKKQSLLELIKRYEEEIKSWEDVERASNLSENEAFANKTTDTSAQDAAKTPSKASMEKSIALATELNNDLEKISKSIGFQGQCIENKLLSIQRTVENAESVKNRVVNKLSNSAFEGYENIGHPKSLIKNLMQLGNQ